MSAQPTAPNTVPTTPPDMVNVEVDGRAMQVKKGSMIIQATDAAKVAVPRFCYHEKLSIAANCRMCLVDVEKSPKPVPACATPVMEGMKIWTQSARALSSQRNVMEFLLINHPLDCPICDQGGECELQDVAMGYGRSVSRFVERKRVVADEDIGPLISTEMTRCIHCTRCVRFMSEIAGTNELGGIGRGEHTEIGTYIGKSIESELGGNIIDVCPVGALTNKVFRFRARPWELIARESIGDHDALGSNLFLHLRRGEVLRVVPRGNESINESWLSDRDRYSHQGLMASDRVTKPMVRDAEGVLREVTWEQALEALAETLRAVAPAETAALVGPSTSNEEALLLSRLFGAIGVGNVDHRLRVIDERLLAGTAEKPVFEMPLAEIEKAGAILIVGSNPRLDQPLLGHRIRKAWKHGAKVFAVNPVQHEFHFDCADEWIAEPGSLVAALASIAKAAVEAGAPVSEGIQHLIASAIADDRARAAFNALKSASSALVLIGDQAVQHADASVLRVLSRFIAAAAEARCNELPNGANGVGLTALGIKPKNGQGASACVAKPRSTLILYRAEVADVADMGAAQAALQAAKTVVAFAAFADETLRARATVLLPLGLTPEIDGSMVNVDGQVQTFKAAAKLPAEARAGWRVLRALGASMELPGFGFTEFAELHADVVAALAQTNSVWPAASAVKASEPVQGDGLTRIATVAPYSVDAVVRRSPALQATPIAASATAAVNPADAKRLGLTGKTVRVRGQNGESTLALLVSNRVPVGGVWIESAQASSSTLGRMGSKLTLTGGEA
ncbi:MAG: NADH-quinone oxidoreductase subunit G [Ahniella sp.]|nr:NADH-quinone oxidoreductase subunit G [Ahniella sp.]